MLTFKQITIAASSVLGAFAISLSMQNGSAMADRAPEQVAGAGPITGTAHAPDAPPPLAVGSFRGMRPGMDLPISLLAPVLTRPEAPTVPGAKAQSDCGVALRGDVQRRGMVSLKVDAPCAARAVGTLHHAGMLVSFTTDAAGQVEIAVPALHQSAMFIVAFQDHTGAVLHLDVPEMAQIERAVLQWQGDDSFAIHAFENGANFGQSGHVHYGAQRVDGAGFVVALGPQDGTDGLRAQVYTYPSHPVSVSLEAELGITEANCGRDMAAQSLQIAPHLDSRAVDLTLTMPNCSAVGDFLILKNMFPEMKLAAK